MGGKIYLGVRVDPDIHEILRRIKEEYGIEYSEVVRLALSWFTPRFYAALKRLELEMIMSLENELDEWVERLKESLKK